MTEHVSDAMRCDAMRRSLSACYVGVKGRNQICGAWQRGRVESREPATYMSVV